VYSLKFANIELGDYFKVTKINKSILPPRENYSMELPKVHGAYYTGYKYQPRVISVDVIINATTPGEYMSTIRTLAYALDIKEPSELIFSDEADKMYYAVIDGSTDIDEILNLGKGTINFICHDPYAYSINEKKVINNGKLFTFINNGTAQTYPTFKAEMSSGGTYFQLTNPDKQVVLIGQRKQADSISKKPSDKVLVDGLDTAIGWTSPGQILDSGRANTGNITIKNSALCALNYGDTAYNGWHGPAVRKILSSNIKDFEVKTRIRFKSFDGTKNLDGEQLGRLEIYGFNNAGGKVFKMTFRDSEEFYEYAQPEFYAGNYLILDDKKSCPSPKKVKQKDKDGKVVTKSIDSGLFGDWNDFFGELIIRRNTDSKGKVKWWCECYRVDPTTLKKKGKVLMPKNWIIDSDYPASELNNVVVWFGQYKDKAICADMSLTHLEVKKLNIYEDIPEVENLEIFDSGDELEINFEENAVYLNGKLFMDSLDIGSEFFSIESGTTEIAYSSNCSIQSAEATFSERWL
jgi:predicted phage tail component-like protein